MHISVKLPKPQSVEKIFWFWMIHTTVSWVFYYVNKKQIFITIKINNKQTKKKIFQQHHSMVDQNMKSCFSLLFLQVSHTSWLHRAGRGNVATNLGEVSLWSISALCDITKGQIAQLTTEKDDLFSFLRGCPTGHKHVANRKCQWLHPFEPLSMVMNLSSGKASLFV